MTAVASLLAVVFVKRIETKVVAAGLGMVTAAFLVAATVPTSGPTGRRSTPRWRYWHRACP